MSLMNQALSWQTPGEVDTGASAQDEAFVPYHGDNIRVTGFLEHVDLPHQVVFQAELEPVRLRAEAVESAWEAAE